MLSLFCALSLDKPTNKPATIMRAFFSFMCVKLLILSLISTSLKGQQTAINFDYLTVLEAPKGPIGFLGTGTQIYAPESNIHIGIRLNNALVGDRAGYYTFGYQLGTHLELTPNVQLSPTIMFTTGGGAESNDGSGGFFTTACALDYMLSKASIGIGYQYSYVSTGVIQGASPYLSMKLFQNLNNNPSFSREAELFVNPILSTYNEHNRTSGFIGIGGRLHNDHTFVSMYLGAAATDLGGYMDVYGGYGYRWDVGAFKWMIEGNFGTGGGGRAPDGCGGLFGAQTELQYHIAKKHVGIAFGGLKSIDAPFYYQFSSLRLGTSLEFGPKNSSRAHFRPAFLEMESSLKSYFGESGFHNLGIAFKLYEYGVLSLLGESYWAFSDGRGAYAEGLFGIRAKKGWLYCEGQLGAGAGGGINLWNGAGLVFTNLGVEVPVNETYTVSGKGVYNLYSTTPFPKLGAQVGLVYKIPFTIR